MIAAKEVNLVLILVTFALVAAEEYPPELYAREYDSFLESGGRKVQDMLDRQRSLSAVRTLFNDLETRMMKRAPYGAPCLGAGMSHNCEFNDLKEALKHVEQISSGHFPGRRKRSSAAAASNPLY